MRCGRTCVRMLRIVPGESDGLPGADAVLPSSPTGCSARSAAASSRRCCSTSNAGAAGPRRHSRNGLPSATAAWTTFCPGAGEIHEGRIRHVAAAPDLVVALQQSARRCPSAVRSPSPRGAPPPAPSLGPSIRRRQSGSIATDSRRRRAHSAAAGGRRARRPAAGLRGVALQARSRARPGDAGLVDDDDFVPGEREVAPVELAQQRPSVSLSMPPGLRVPRVARAVGEDPDDAPAVVLGCAGSRVQCRSCCPSLLRLQALSRALPASTRLMVVWHPLDESITSARMTNARPHGGTLALGSPPLIPGHGDDDVAFSGVPPNRCNFCSCQKAPVLQAVL